MEKIDRPLGEFDHPVLKGGAGSGNRGHVGRPGERGGSGAADITPRSVLGNTKATEPRSGKGQKVDSKQYESKLTPAEKTALETYCNQASANINDNLRQGKQLLPEYAQTAKDLQSAVKKADSTERLVYRGVRLQSMEPDIYSGERRAFVKQFEDNVGKTVALKGYQSTSTSPDLAAKFAGVNDNPIFEINSKGGAPIGGMFGRNENEVILPPNAKYKVVDVVHNVSFHNADYPNRNRFTVIKLEMK